MEHAVGRTKYGSNNCTMDWGKTYSVAVDLTLGQDIVTGATFDVDLEIKAVIKVPWKFSCPLCGGQCQTEVPIVGKKIDVTMPDCPIKAAEEKTTKSLALPDKNPLPLKATVSGTITAKQQQQTIVVGQIERRSKCSRSNR
eukprot:UN04817